MKHTKKKRKSRKTKKHIVGGHATVVTMEDIYNYATNPDINYEVCGYVSNNTHYMEPQEAPQDTTRLNCTSSDAPTIWHTHPAKSKYYPSYEDIRKLLKRNNTTKSIIYTRFGHWILEYLDEKDTASHLIDYQYNKPINKALDTFYYESGKGREYNLNAINKLINSISLLFDGKYNITFESIP